MDQTRWRRRRKPKPCLSRRLEQTEAQLLDEFVPEEKLLHKCEAVIRVFNKYGNRKNKNKARLKFVVRERGFEWVREEIEKEYQDILANGGIATPEMVPEGFGGYQSTRSRWAPGALLPVVGLERPSARGLRSLARNQRARAETDRLRHGHRAGRSGQPDRATRCAGWRSSPATSGDGLLRVTIDQNLVLAYIPLARLPQVYAALERDGPGRRRRATRSRTSPPAQALTPATWR